MEKTIVRFFPHNTCMARINQASVKMGPFFIWLELLFNSSWFGKRLLRAVKVNLPLEVNIKVITFREI